MNSGTWVVWVVPWEGCGEPTRHKQAGKRAMIRHAEELNWSLNTRGNKPPSDFIDRFVAAPYSDPPPDQRPHPTKAAEDSAGKYPGMYPPGYLEDLRNEWPD